MEKEIMKKRNRILLILAGLFLIVLMAKSIEANFVCGQVNDSEEMAAAWYDVRIFYSEGNYATCKVSPDGNKYCCDTEAIPNYNWKVGDVIKAEIYDNVSGYFAGPVSVVTSGEGYDIFPQMQLKKAIKIFSPEGKLLFSNESKFFLNASFSEPYNYVEIERDGEREVLCENCSNFSGEINGSFGFNDLKILSSFRDNTLYEEIVLWILRGFDFKRVFNCRGCLRNLVKTNRKVDVKIEINLSHEVENLELREYVPVEWKILESDGRVENYSASHNVIVWNVSGKEIVKNYKVKSPRIWFFPRKYIFKTELENQLLNKEYVIVYRWIRFLPFKRGMKLEPIKKTKYFKIGPATPLIIKPKDKRIQKLVIIPKREFNKIDFDLDKLKKPKISNLIDCYKIDTNLGKDDISKIFLEIKMKKWYMWLMGYRKLRVYVFDGEKWREEKMELYNKDRKYLYYRGLLEPGKKIAISGVRKNFLDIFNFYS